MMIARSAKMHYFITSLLFAIQLNAHAQTGEHPQNCFKNVDNSKIGGPISIDGHGKLTVVSAKGLGTITKTEASKDTPERESINYEIPAPDGSIDHLTYVITFDEQHRVVSFKENFDPTAIQKFKKERGVLCKDSRLSSCYLTESMEYDYTYDDPAFHCVMNRAIYHEDHVAKSEPHDLLRFDLSVCKKLYYLSQQKKFKN